ncbi:Type 12 methyltransferase [Rhodospirillaceae bacterium LM-1]|nr:Type 12 methyltransferase [Rhodospirillaceae bacterium LM-1]
MDKDPNYYDGRDLEALASLRRYQNWIVEHFQPYLKGEVVEYGAGVGNISVLLAQHAESLQFVEPSPNLFEQLGKRFAHESRVSIHMAGLEEHAASLPDASIDGFVLVNVLEHIEDDASALAQMSRALKPGGHLMLFVPALEFLMSPMDHRLQHKRRYHRRPLCDRVEKTGLKVLNSRYMDLLGVAAWWLFHVVGKRTEFNPDMAMLYDRLFVPLTRGIERLIRPQIGKSLVLIARKPDSPKP